MESLVPALAEWGVPRADLHFEAFGPASVRLPGATPNEATASTVGPLEVRFTRSGRTLVWDGQDANLLDFAERHGVSVESGCRSGGCGTCETPAHQRRRSATPACQTTTWRPASACSASANPVPRWCWRPESDMQARLLRREVLPFLLAMAALVLVAVLVDPLLHLLDVYWIGRYLGIPGTLLILGSTAYSLRKRKLIKSGHPAKLLRLHEWMAWLGSLLVLVHAGIHFNAILGWLAVGAMLINVGSGLTGKFLLDRSRRRLEEAHKHMRQKGITAGGTRRPHLLGQPDLRRGQELAGRALSDHAAFGVLATAHIVAVFLFWGWR